MRASLAALTVLATLVLVPSAGASTFVFVCKDLAAATTTAASVSG